MTQVESWMASKMPPGWEGLQWQGKFTKGWASHGVVPVLGGTAGIFKI